MSPDNDQQFEMGMQMHRDTHELIRSLRTDMATITAKLDKHVDEDKKVHEVVARHTTYWKTATGAVSALIAGAGAHLGLK